MKQLVVVVWDDTEDPKSGGWLDQADMETFVGENCMVESVGFLVSKTNKYVTLSADWIKKLGHWGRVTKIPTGMVESITTLREASE